MADLRAEPRRVDPEKPHPDRRPIMRRFGWITGAVAAVTLIAFAVGTWYAYTQGMRAGTESVAPLVRADRRPEKVKPADPGGMEVPHQDKTVYDRMAPDDSQKRVEQLLPPPEEPVARPKPKEAPPEPAPAPAQTAPQAKPEPPKAESPKPAPPKADAPKPAEPPKAEPQQAAPTPATAAPPQSAATPSPPAGAPTPLTPQGAQQPSAVPQPAQQAPQQAAAPKATPAPQAAQAGTYRVQLGALRSEDDAKKEWAKLQAKHGAALAGLGLSIQKVDLGSDKGVFYRMQAGPLASADAAHAVCDKLKQQGGSCLVVRP